MELFQIQEQQHDDIFNWIKGEQTNDLDALINTFI